MVECVLKNLLQRRQQSNPAQRAAQMVIVAGLFVIAGRLPELVAIRRLQEKPLFYPPVTAQQYEGFTIDWSHFGETYFWLRAGVLEEKVARWADFLFLCHSASEATEADAVIVSRKPSLTALYSGRQSTCYPFYTDHELQRAFLLKNKVDYVIIDGIFTETHTYLVPYMRQNSDAFTVIRKSKSASLVRVSREKL